MKQIRLIIWDWNGTLLDDVLLNLEITNIMLQSRGIPPLSGLDAYRYAFHFPIIEYYEAIGFRFDKESYEQVADEYHRLYTAHVHECTIFPDAKTVLHAIASQQIPQVLLSATRQDRLEHQVNNADLTGYFSTILGQKDGLSYGKTETARQLCSTYGLRPDSILMVGDTTHDAEIAQSIGAQCILCDAGHQSHRVLEQCKVPVVSNLTEILSLI